MSEAQIMSAILLAGLLIGILAKWLLDNVIYHTQNLLDILENNKSFAAKKAAMEKMKTNGDLHEWVNMPIEAEMRIVCKKTGWCPSLEGFVPLQSIREYLERVKTEEEYRTFRNARVQLLAHENEMSVMEMERIVEQIFKMKKDFYLGKMAQSQQDMQARAASVRNEQV